MAQKVFYNWIRKPLPLSQALFPVLFDEEGSVRMCVTGIEW
jgi:hypothetical protein